MIYFLLGLVLFLGVHSVRIVADNWRTSAMSRFGYYPWKAVYAVASIAGFALLVWGYGQVRHESMVLYNPPLFMRHIAGLLMLVSLVLVAAAYVPRNHLKTVLGHPMYAGIKVWALAHLLSNGRLADVVLFGAFLVWAIAGVGVWAALVSGLHLWLIGVAPFA